MADTLKTYIADHELAVLLKDAAQSGAKVRVRAEEKTYVVRIESEPDSNDLWAGYDAEQLRVAVRRNAAMGTTTDTEQLDKLIAEIRAQRDQAPRRW